jgi:hypothetical protein
LNHNYITPVLNEARGLVFRESITIATHTQATTSDVIMLSSPYGFRKFFILYMLPLIVIRLGKFVLEVLGGGANLALKR